jgi:hypothetical protein
VVAVAAAILLVLAAVVVFPMLANSRNTAPVHNAADATDQATATDVATPTLDGTAADTPSDTPAATDTPADTPTPDLQATQVAATQTAIAAQATANAQATAAAAATATATAFLPYFAARPGPCDSGGAIWLAYPDASGMSCTADSTRIRGGAAIEFSSPYHYFPPNFTESVEFMPGSTCGWFDWRYHDIGTPGGTIGVCSAGSWNINYGWVHGPTGTTTATTWYTLAIRVQNGVQTIWVNGTQVDQHQIDAGSLPPIAVSMGMNPGDPQTVAFKNFTLTPL